MDELEAQKAADQEMVNYKEKVEHQEELAVKTMTTLEIQLNDLDELKA